MATLPDGFGGPAPSVPPEERLPTFQLPHSIDVFEYPKYIRDFEKHINRLRKAMAEEEIQRDARKNYLHATEWHSLGANNDIRDSKFKVMLLGDELYNQHDRRMFDLSWHIKAEQADLDKLTSESINARLRYRNSLVAAELFAGVPIDPKDI